MDSNFNGIFSFFFFYPKRPQRAKGVMEIYFPCVRSLARVQINIPQSIFSIVIVENNRCHHPPPVRPGLSVFFTESAIAFRTERGEKNKYSFTGVIAARLESFYFLPLCGKRRGGKGSRKSPGTIFTKTLRGSIA